MRARLSHGISSSPAPPVRARFQVVGLSTRLTRWKIYIPLAVTVVQPWKYRRRVGRPRGTDEFNLTTCREKRRRTRDKHPNDAAVRNIFEFLICIVRTYEFYITFTGKYVCKYVSDGNTVDDRMIVIEVRFHAQTFLSRFRRIPTSADQLQSRQTHTQSVTQLHVTSSPIKF